jgi:hypothetical protein
VVTSWILVIGIGLFFNAGLFRRLFDQESEPGLLPDEILFRRVPVAYLVLLVGVTALAWVIDRTGPQNLRHGVVLGAIAGVVFAAMGVVYLWTAIDMTGVFVVAGALVLVVEFASAGWTLAGFRSIGDPVRLTRRVLVVELPRSGRVVWGEATLDGRSLNIAGREAAIVRLGR